MATTRITPDGPTPAGGPAGSRWRRLRRVLVGVAVVVALIAVAVGLLYRDQIVRYATHRKGSPTHTVAWAPFPTERPPLLHLALAGDVGDSGSRIDATGRAVAGLDAV